MSEPDFAILLTIANRCVADRLLQAVSEVDGGTMRNSFGFVLRAVAAEQPTVSRLAELLGVSKQAASHVTEDMVSRGLLRRGVDPNDRRRTPLQLTALGERVRVRALAESSAMESELRRRFGDSMIEQFRTVITAFVESHGAGAELTASRSRTSIETP